MDRRYFLGMAATGVAAALSGALGGCTDAGSMTGPGPAAGTGAPDTSGVLGATASNGSSGSATSGYPSLQSGPPTSVTPTGKPASVITRLPGKGSLLALTVDDGVNPVVVRAYCDLARQTGLRLTFFVTAAFASWTDNAAVLRPLVDSGQIQLGNHTWSHPSLTTLSSSRIAEEITRCEKFLTNTYGVTGRPFLRPPYGAHNATTRAVAASLGYTTTTMWEGSFADSGLLSEKDLLAMADRWLLAQHIVIGHANYETVTRVYGQILDLIRARSLQTVTLDDVFFPDGARARRVPVDPSYPSDKLTPWRSTPPPVTLGGATTTSGRPVRT